MTRGRAEIDEDLAAVERQIREAEASAHVCGSPCPDPDHHTRIAALYERAARLWAERGASLSRPGD